jgi:hypothetical protein
VTNVVFPGCQAQPLSLNRTRMADNHVEQENAILFARHTIRPALVHFITMLTDRPGWFHKTLSMSKVYAFCGVDVKSEAMFAAAGHRTGRSVYNLGRRQTECAINETELAFALQRRHTHCRTSPAELA